jgi:hypothetical protein
MNAQLSNLSSATAASTALTAAKYLTTSSGKQRIQHQQSSTPHRRCGASRAPGTPSHLACRARRSQRPHRGGEAAGGAPNDGC